MFLKLLCSQNKQHVKFFNEVINNNKKKLLGN